MLVTSSSTAVLTWNPPEVTLRNGEITFYTINVSVIESEEMFQLTSLSVELELSSLRPYHTYMFEVAGSTIAGEGPFSEAISVLTPEDGKHIMTALFYDVDTIKTLFSLYSAVPTAPVSVDVNTVAGQPSQLLVTWQPPDVPNGVVSEYRVFCFESMRAQDSSDGSGEDYDITPTSIPFQDSVSNTTVLGNELSAVMGGLNPYTRYYCTAIAYTSAGEGEASIFVSAVTDQSSKWQCKIPNIYV